jgi:dimethylargininase
MARPLPHALVREVSPRLAEAELTFLDRVRVDVERAAAQHAGYVALLQRLGHEVVHVAPSPEHPDGTFVEDAAVVVDDLAVCTRPGAASRRGEVATVREALLSLGVRTVGLEEPATLDGGDVLQVGPTVFVGLGGRTNPAGVARLEELLAPLGRSVVPVAVTGCLHLKSGATALPDGTVVAVTSWLDTTAFEAAGLEVVEAPEPAGADLLLSGDRVVVSAAAPGTVELVRRRGFPAHPVAIDELEKAECGVTCLSVLVHPAARG